VDKKGKKLDNKIWSRGKREPNIAVAFLSGIPFFAAKSKKAFVGVREKSSECRLRIDMGRRARRNPVAIAASRLGCRERIVNVCEVKMVRQNGELVMT
jgi:hypothetical protein